MCSCSQNMLLDKQGKEDLMVCSGACVVSSSIRKDAETLVAFQKASDIIGTIIKNDQVTRDELQAKLTEALSKLFSKQIVDKVVSEIMNVYDENMADAAKFCASQIFWGTYGGLFGEGWEIEVKVSDGFSDETYHLVSFINEDDETFDFKEIV